MSNADMWRDRPNGLYLYPRKTRGIQLIVAKVDDKYFWITNPRPGKQELVTSPLFADLWIPI